jgi:hypothetical protein
LVSVVVERILFLKRGIARRTKSLKLHACWYD